MLSAKALTALQTVPTGMSSTVEIVETRSLKLIIGVLIEARKLGRGLLSAIKPGRGIYSEQEGSLRLGRHLAGCLFYTKQMADVISYIEALKENRKHYADGKI